MKAYNQQTSLRKELSAGPIPFNIFISDLSEGIESTFSKFADGMKLGQGADLPEGYTAIQQDLNRLLSWAERNLISFIKSKYWILLLEKNSHMH